MASSDRAATPSLSGVDSQELDEDLLSTWYVQQRQGTAAAREWDDEDEGDAETDPDYQDEADEDDDFFGEKLSRLRWRSHFLTLEDAAEDSAADLELEVFLGGDEDDHDDADEDDNEDEEDGDGKTMMGIRRRTYSVDAEALPG